MACFSSVSSAKFISQQKILLHPDSISEKNALRISYTTQFQGSDGKMTRIDNKASLDYNFNGLYNLSNIRAATPAATAVTERRTSFSEPKTKVEPLEKIKKGFLKFKEHYKQERETFKQLAELQTPPFMIISCADSRVDPCKILGLDMGDAFVVRNIANLVPNYSEKTCTSTAAAIEFAVLQLKVKHLMVIGHSRCGGIRALMGMKEDRSNRFSEFIEDWVLIGKEVSSKVKNLQAHASFDEQCICCEKESVDQSLMNCLSFPFVREKVENGELSLHGAYYDFVDGSFERWSVGCTSGTMNVIESEKLE